MRVHIYIYIYIDIVDATHIVNDSEGGMIRLEALIELKFTNSSFSRLSS